MFILFDILVTILIFTGAYRGFSKGLLLEIGGIMALFLGVLCGIYLSFPMESILKTLFDWSDTVVFIISFIVVFGSVVALVRLGAKYLSHALSLLALGIFNQLLGGIFGFIKITFIIGLIVLFVLKVNETIHFLSTTEIESSFLMLPVKDFAAAVFPPLLEKLGV